MAHSQFALCLNAVYTVLGLLFLGGSALGLRNVTVDDTSALITYAGTWLHSTGLTDRFNGTTHYTKVQGSYATFSFTGAIAVAYIGFGLEEKNDRNTTTMDVVFDGTLYRADQAHTESSQRPQALIWSSTLIDAGQTHTIVCRMTNADGNMGINVDAFILSIPETGDAPFITQESTSNGASVAASPSSETISELLAPSTVWVPEDGTTRSVTTTASAQSTNTPDASPTNSPSNRVPSGAIAGGVAGTLVFVSLCCLAVYLLRRHGRFQLPRSALAVTNVENDDDMERTLDTPCTGDTASVEVRGSEADSEEWNSGEKLVPSTLMTSLPMATEKEQRGKSTGAGALPQSALTVGNVKNDGGRLDTRCIDDITSVYGDCREADNAEKPPPPSPSPHLCRRASNELLSSPLHHYTYPSPDPTRPNHQSRDQDGGGQCISGRDMATEIISGRKKGDLQGDMGKAQQQGEALGLGRQDNASGISAVQGDELTGLNIEQLMEKHKPEDLTGQITIDIAQKPFHGGYGSVYVGIFRQQKVAVKTIDARTNPEEEDINEKQRYERRVRREINIWAALKHPNICELLGYTTSHSDYYAMVSPWCDGQTATQYLQKTLSVKERVILAHDVSKGLQYMHNLKVIHGDIKTTNVLVDKHGVAKLCDFGLARLSWQRPTGMTTTTPYTGTTEYKAPELFISKENRFPVPTFEGDIYSLGCIMLEFIERLRPFKRPSTFCEGQDVIKRSLCPAERFKTNHALGPDMTERFWDLLEACWKGPTERPNMHHIMEELDFFVQTILK